MARSRGSRGPAGRSGSPFRSGPRPGSSSQIRSASTMAAPAPPNTAYSQPPATAVRGQSQQPGMFAQMASTAAGVAVGSAVGHTLGAGITGMFSGSGSNNDQAVSQDMSQQQGLQANSQLAAQEQSKACDVDARNFTRCLDENNGNFQICDYYLQQLKACQEAARLY